MAFGWWLLSSNMEYFKVICNPPTNAHPIDHVQHIMKVEAMVLKIGWVQVFGDLLKRTLIHLFSFETMYLLLH